MQGIHGPLATASHKGRTQEVTATLDPVEPPFHDLASGVRDVLHRERPSAPGGGFGTHLSSLSGMNCQPDENSRGGRLATLLDLEVTAGGDGGLLLSDGGASRGARADAEAKTPSAKARPHPVAV